MVEWLSKVMAREEQAMMEWIPHVTFTLDEVGSVPALLSLKVVKMMKWSSL